LVWSPITETSTAAGSVVPVEVSRLVGVWDPVVFAGRLAVVVLSYDGWTDFAGRVSQVLWLAAPDPLGDPAGLASDLSQYTPHRDGRRPTAAAGAAGGLHPDAGGGVRVGGRPDLGYSD
jgi:hypothetical protein